MGQIRTIGVVVLLATAATLCMASPASATSLDYAFDNNNQGWQQSQDNGNTVSSAGFRGSGGNPGGRLTATDTGAEDGCSTDTSPCDLLTFFSPFVSPLGANYGGTASFDLRSSVNPDFAAELLLLPTGPNYLDGLIQETPGTGYHHLAIQMIETANWAVCPYLGGTCSPPTQGQFIDLIAASDVVAVIADVGPDGMTGETYDLDNVSLTDGGGLPTPPPPSGSPTPPTQKHKPKKCKKKHRRAAAAKKGKCKKKKKKRRRGGLSAQRLTTGASTPPSRQRS